MSTQNRRSSFSSSTSSSLAKRQHASSSENLGKVKAEAKKRAPLNNLTNLNNFPSHGSRSLGPSSTMNRRSSFSSSTSSSPAKRQHASSSENIGKVTAAAKKRAPLTNLTNLKNFPSHGSRSLGPSSTMVPCSTKIGKSKKGSPIPIGGTSFSKNALPLSSNMKTSSVGAFRATPLLRSHEIAPSFPVVSASCSMDVSPSKSDGNSVSMDETMSTCDSFKSPEYVDNNGPSEIDSVDRNFFGNLNLSDHTKTADAICGRDTLADMETDDKIVNVDSNYTDPQLCATIACDIYKHLRATEVNKRPSTNFMERIQTDINANMRSILVDWLVEVAEEYRLVPDTLYLTVNYIDRYLSGNAMNRQRLQLLGVACMMIAAKYEEICSPQVEEFCYITDNTYFKDEVLEMESSVLNYLKFELTAATAKCFLRRFVRAAQGVSEDPSMLLECLANYFTELSLLEYNMLCYQPSLIAASAIFLANFVLNPSRRPWNSTLRHYTLYQLSDLRDCVKDLHRLCCNNYDSTLPAIREKYSQHKYKCVATKACPPLIPPEFFHDLSH